MQVKPYPLDHRYKIHTNGTVIGPSGKQLKPYVNFGYLTVGIGGKRKKIHRLVCETFLPQVDGMLDVNHINGIKSDNRLENLEWTNDRLNIKHAFMMGLRSHKGQNNSRAKIPAEHIPIIKEAINAGYNPKNIGKYYGVAKQTIYSIKYSKNWSHL